VIQYLPAPADADFFPRAQGQLTASMPDDALAPQRMSITASTDTADAAVHRASATTRADGHGCAGGGSSWGSRRPSIALLGTDREQHQGGTIRWKYRRIGPQRQSG